MASDFHRWQKQLNIKYTIIWAFYKEEEKNKKQLNHVFSLLLNLFVLFLLVLFTINLRVKSMALHPRVHLKRLRLEVM